MELNRLKQQDISTLNHHERLRIMKDIKYQKEFEMMKQAAQENVYNQNKAKQMKYDQFYAKSNLS